MKRLVPLEDLRKLPSTGELWAVVDACDEPDVPSKMYELGTEKAVSLYRGDAEHEHATIAPYLVRVDDGVLDWVVQGYWDKPWGIFALAQEKITIEKLRTHFRKFLTVKSPEGEKMYFRYYDPRILKHFLPTCRDDELKDLFGPLEAYGVADAEENGVILFTWKQQASGTNG